MIAIPVLLSLPLFIIAGIECYGKRDQYIISSICGVDSPSEISIAKVFIFKATKKSNSCHDSDRHIGDERVDFIRYP
uniref:Uncharacterized protein n=1 Tax=Acrobeloides nanus TaxID=290746 RepID=A0A914CM10_9BILA